MKLEAIQIVAEEIAVATLPVLGFWITVRPRPTNPRIRIGSYLLTAMAQTIWQRDRQVEMRRALQESLDTPREETMIVSDSICFRSFTMIDVKNNTLHLKFKHWDEKHGGDVLRQRLKYYYTSESIAIKSLTYGISLGTIPFMLQFFYCHTQKAAAWLSNREFDTRTTLRRLSFEYCLNITCDLMLRGGKAPYKNVPIYEPFVYESVHRLSYHNKCEYDKCD